VWVKVVPVDDVKVVYKGDTMHGLNHQLFIPAERGKKPLELELVSKDTSKVIQLKSRLSSAYWLNLYPSFFWLGFLVDRDNPKRYTYPGSIYVKGSDSIRGYTTYDPRGEKGKWKVQLSYPQINNFLLKPAEVGTRWNTGFAGVSVGADYYYHQRRFVSLTVNAVTNFFLPFPVGAYDRFGGTYEDIRSIYVGLATNYKIRHATIGYGISYGLNSWCFSTIRETPYSYAYGYTLRRSYALGLLFPVSYEFNRNFFVGAVYRPTFLQFAKKTHVEYEHFLGLEWGWRFALN
jgi:hypothetical protein